VLIADDHPLYREALVEAIRSRPDLELVAEVGDGREALQEMTRLTPDVAVLDMRMPEFDGPRVLEAARRERPQYADPLALRDRRKRGGISGH